MGCKPNVVLSESEESTTSQSESDEPTAPPPGLRLPHVDFAASTPRISRAVKPSAKEKENRDRAEATKDDKLAKMEKKLKNAQKKLNKTNARLQEYGADRMPMESEEEDDDAPVDMSSFSASFTSRGIVSRAAPKTATKKLRKGGEAPITTPMSRIPLSNLQDTPNIPGSFDDAAQVSGAGDDVDDARSSPAPQVPRKRARSSSPTKRRKKRAKVAEPLPQAEFVAGKAPGGSRTNLKGYTEPARALLKNAMHRYEVRVDTLNTYPGAELQMQWVKEIWDEVCTEAEERMQLTERMTGMITKYGSHARSAVVGCVRPLIAPTFGFKLGDSDKVLRKNLKLHQVLLNESGFHYKNDIVMESMRVTWFKNKSARGVHCMQAFSPITLVTLALIFTAIEFCIEEYSTGRFQPGTFDEVENKERYMVHLQDLTEWAALKPSVTDVIRQQMHDKLRATTGAALVKPTGRMSEAGRARALEELEAMNVDQEGVVSDEE
ncbi:hypothetical protein C8F04DRAFT_1306567 [Mycena alexandri]|uniref:DUF6532 domain-containing protein n=1 Tax=Mycena alexandri TaxID=1745969 RepID=A0AAD6WRW0_9AGAR|nr:hypothetical protein C8F04DRAFT_1306567 [Mycena alexandri]